MFSDQYQLSVPVENRRRIFENDRYFANSLNPYLDHMN